jgi:CubicO group peptidase (beta-lactamase class C family)
MRRLASASLLAALLLGTAVLAGAPPDAGSPAPVLSPSALAPIADLVSVEIDGRRIPGAVVFVGQGDRVVYQRAFGGERAPLSIDTLFDLASLTKVVATTTAVMQLAERGRLDVDAPAARYWPAFGAAGKQRITVRDLLTHYSGLKPDLDLSRRWSGYGTAMAMLVAERPRHPAGTRYVYSDENFEVLGEIVRRVSGMSLDAYCEREIFGPLGMRDTRFRPTASDAARIAPTGGAMFDRDGIVLVNDPTARRMGGVAGHAGLFSTAGDLALFASMLLDGGTSDGVRILQPSSIVSMTRRASPGGGSHERGLGWDLAAAFTPPRDGDGANSYGHTGYTGTMLWIDPATRTYVVVLSNRTYPDGRGDAQPLRKAVLAHVSSVLAGGAAPEPLQSR